MKYDELIIKFVQAEFALTQERKEILDQLRDEKRSILLSLLANNMDSTRRLRSMKESVLGRISRNVLENDDETDEDEDLCIKGRRIGDFANELECFTKCEERTQCQNAWEKSLAAQGWVKKDICSSVKG